MIQRVHCQDIYDAEIKINQYLALQLQFVERSDLFRGVDHESPAFILDNLKQQEKRGIKGYVYWVNIWWYINPTTNQWLEKSGKGDFGCVKKMDNINGILVTWNKDCEPKPEYNEEKNAWEIEF